MDEAPKRDQTDAGSRGAFERDRARVLHSYAFRRLADKTQVVSPGQDDFPRTRLTHSLEVAQIGREMGAALGCDPDIVDAAGLAHDLGHPPFGHNGEDALDTAARAGGLDGFEGNAQTLRILTRLEAKTVTGQPGRPVGLNLTRASLDAVCKYPVPAGPGVTKFAAYGSDLAAYRWLRDGRPDGVRCLEAQVMDWADDVAYSVHDVEDGVHSGHIRLADLLGPDGEAERAALCEQACGLYSPLGPNELAPVLDRLLQLAPVRELTDYDGTFLAQANAKRATSELTGRFVGAAVAATREKFGTEPLGRYQAELVVPEPVAAECALLKALAFRYVMRRPGVEQVLGHQKRVLSELVRVLLDRGEPALSLVLAESWRAAEDDLQRLRVVIDQVAQLTDSAALAWHQRLVGEPA
ncbi:MAG: deoxyguanosinetriphosphate triphosphohydrolase [Actinomycetota bacterium]|nr:deoxyguanosinetriphosphate triphosphohydrolase [Actinomycetota bacterium]MDQ2955748.1 deoxyguanosinetriphosphate triphosphohydrolase [Actinomycetota bacterium]